MCGLYSPPMHTKMREGGGVSRNFAMKSRCRSEAFAGPKIGGRKARVAAGRAAAGRGGVGGGSTRRPGGDADAEGLQGRLERGLEGGLEEGGRGGDDT